MITINTRTSIERQSPYGDNAMCTQFTIDDTTSKFRFNFKDKVLIGNKYTFSTYIEPEQNCSIYIEDKRVDLIANQWNRVVVTLYAKNAFLYIRFSTNGVYYFYHSQYEKGTKDSDWSRAPEDITEENDENLAGVYQSMSEQRTNIIQEANRLILSATETLVQTGDYDEYKQTVASRLEMLANEITMSFTTVSEQVDNVNKDAQGQFSKLYKYISMSDRGIVINSGENSIELQLDSEDGIVFSKNGTAFGTWDGENFHTGNIVIDVTQRAQFGNFAFVPRSDGSLSFLKVGDQ